MPDLSRLFKKPKTEPLPKFERIAPADIPPASTLLFYGSPGNKLTQMVGERIYKHPFSPPAFHAAFYIGDGQFLNVGKFKTIQEIEKEFRSTRRVDVITYTTISPDVAARLCKLAEGDISRPKVGLQFPDYAMTDYLRFAVKWFRPSKKDFCSENVVEIFKFGGVTVSDQEPYNCAPWDLLEWALAHPYHAKIRTVWQGEDFR